MQEIKQETTIKNKRQKKINQKIKRKKVIDDDSDDNEFKGKSDFNSKRHKRSKRIKDQYFCVKGKKLLDSNKDTVFDSVTDLKETLMFPMNEFFGQSVYYLRECQYSTNPMHIRSLSVCGDHDGG